MLLAIGPLTPLAGLLQIICWIIIPVLGLSVSVAAIHHYFRKKRNASKALADEELASLTSPSDGEASYLYFDHSGVIRQYREKLTYSHARYAALKKDYEKLEKKYGHSQKTVKDRLVKQKKDIMENSTTPDNATGTINATTLPATPFSQDSYLKDLVEEKTTQITFLQSQLEQRIRKYHESENANQQLQEHLAYTEGQLTDLRQQNELLNAAAIDNQERSELLYKELQDEQAKLASVEQKLLANRQLLQRLYKEFSACMEDEADESSSPVVSLKSGYFATVAEEY